MSRLDLLAETTKLSRLLEVPESELAYLHKLGSGPMRELRQRISAAVFDESAGMLQRVARASKLLPAPAIALIGEKVFGPLLCASTAGLLPAERALDVALRLPDAFLAEVAVRLDPRSAHEVIGRMPVERVAAVAAVLLRQRDYVTMGRFVDYLAPATIKTVIEGITDDAALLHVAFYVENKPHLNQIVGLLPEARLRRIIEFAGAEGSGLWAEALALMSHITPDWQRRIGDLAAAQDEAVLTRLLRTVQHLGLWDALLPIIGNMSEASRRRLARVPALAEREVMAAVISAADAQGLWQPLLPLVTEMSAEARRAAAGAVEHLPPALLQGLLEAVQASGLWQDLIGLLALMEEPERRNIVRLLAQQDEAMLAQLLLSTHEKALWPQLLPLLAVMPDAQLTALNQLAVRLGLDWKT